MPFGELLIDRSKKASLLNFGEGTTIHDSSYVYGDVAVGKNTWIGPFTVLDGSGGLKIGANCSISTGVQIYSHDTIDWATSGGEKPYEYAPVVIEDNCYIGPNSIIQKGVTIKKGQLLEPTALLTKTSQRGQK